MERCGAGAASGRDGRRLARILLEAGGGNGDSGERGRDLVRNWKGPGLGEDVGRLLVHSKGLGASPFYSHGEDAVARPRHGEDDDDG